MLKVEHLSAGYNGRFVVQDINFTLERGESLAIIGPNSCGKTTLLRAIAGLLPYEGNIFVDNMPLKDMKRKEIAARIAMMSQLSTISFPFSIEETVMMGRYLSIRDNFFGKPQKKDYDHVEEVMAKLNLLEIRKKTLNQLSGGQIQRVFLAHTMVQEPKIILLDEPTNHMDMHYQLDMVGQIKKWASEEDHVAIGVFHDINLAMELTDNLLFMKEGKLIGFGKAKDLITPAFLQSIYGLDVVEFMIESYGRWLEFEGKK